MSSPTARTLKALRELGYVAEVVERYNSFTKRRTDLYGVIDILAVSPEGGILGVQATAGSDHAARRTKILAEPRVAVWLAAGGRLEVWSWRLGGPAGKRKTWQLRVERIEDAQPAVPVTITP